MLVLLGSEEAISSERVFVGFQMGGDSMFVMFFSLVES